MDSSAAAPRSTSDDALRDERGARTPDEADVTTEADTEVEAEREATLHDARDDENPAGHDDEDDDAAAGLTSHAALPNDSRGGAPTSSSAWITYTVVRLLAFALPCAAVMLALPQWEWNWALGVAVGALVSLLVSYVFLRRQRDAMARGLAAARAPKDARSADEIAEDEAVDQAEVSSLERPDAADEDDEEEILFEEERTPAPADVEPVDGAPDPDDIDASTTSSLEQAPPDEDSPHEAFERD